MAKNDEISILSTTESNTLYLLIIRGDGMENVDLCVCCGDIVPEGMMVCPDCLKKYESVSTKDIVAFITEFYDIKLYWYQKLFLKIFERSIKNSPKGFTYR